MARGQHSDEVDTNRGAPRANRLARLAWTRALPGSVAVVAALTIPEFSVGAGDLGAGKSADRRLPPSSAADQATPRGQASAGKAPLAGVRYAALLDIAPAAPRAAATSAAAPPPRRQTMTGAAPSSAIVELSQAVAIETALALPVPLAAAMPGTAAAPRLAAPADAVLGTAAGGATSVPDAAPIAVVPLPAPAIAPLPATAAMRADVISAALIVPDALGALAPATGPAALTLAQGPTALRGATPDAVAAVMPGLVSGSTPPGGRGGIAQLTPSLAAPAMPAASAAPPIMVAPQSASAVPPSAAAVAANPATPPGLGTSSAAPFALAIAARLVTRVDGKVAGTVDFQQTATGLTVRLGSIVDVLSDRYDPAQIARIQSSTARNVYLSLTDLQAQGIPISYDPVYDEFNVGQTDTRPRSARKVHIDQISAPERGQGSAAIGQVRRP